MRVDFFKLDNKKLLIIKRVLFVILSVYWGFFGVIIVGRCASRAVAYPLGYKEEVYEYSEQYKIDKMLVFAMIKVESGFKANAESKAGAKGLMQMTDKTAGYVAKMLGEEEYDLFDAKTNIRYGCRYLSYLFERFENRETAVCAYNAGEGNVTLWLNNPEYSDDKITLKTVPYPETREYIKKINQTFSKYKKLYGNILDKHKNFE